MYIIIDQPHANTVLLILNKVDYFSLWSCTTNQACIQFLVHLFDKTFHYDILHIRLLHYKWTNTMCNNMNYNVNIWHITCLNCMRKITLQLASHKSQRATNIMQMHWFDWFIHSGVILACIELPQNSGLDQTLEIVSYVFMQFAQIKMPCKYFWCTSWMNVAKK